MSNIVDDKCSQACYNNIMKSGKSPVSKIMDDFFGKT